VADGNIHVYAALRGKAMAGARGNAKARIFALSLEPELVSIAGVYRTSENPFPKEVHGKTAQVPGPVMTDKKNYRQKPSRLETLHFFLKDPLHVAKIDRRYIGQGRVGKTTSQR